ncbi:MAG: hypothetical protein HWD86_07230 [Kangiellaceae bacterium]|nr:hypothetical protein [Kangiellaceae bacterium]
MKITFTKAILALTMFSSTIFYPLQAFDFIEKNIPETHFIYKTISAEANDFHSQSKAAGIDIMRKLATKIRVKAAGDFTGVILQSEQKNPNILVAQVGFPIAKAANSQGRLKYQKLESLKVVAVHYQGSRAELAQAWQDLYQYVIAQGYQLNGESRFVINAPEKEGMVDMELQVGVQP